MPQPTASIVDALSGDEVCPLCYDQFSAADACSCVVCRVSSCPSCAEVLDRDGAARCFACRPSAPAPLLAARAAASISLPRPIATDLGVRAWTQAASSYTPGVGAARLPLPFPLTTSPQGVRVLQPKPPGSVFIGLPALPARLAQSLRAPAPQAKLAGRPLQKLRLLTHALGALSALITLCERALAKEQRELWDARLTALARAVTRHGTFALHTLAEQASSLAHWLARHAEPRLRTLSARLTRAKPAVVDPSRPIGS